MQRNGLEWAYRLSREPRRLWRRYARYNPLFVAGFARQYARHRRDLARSPPAATVRAQMSRVLITGGAGMIGAAVARRLLADPQYDVRVSDERDAPQWMREGCEIRGGDLRAPATRWPRRRAARTSSTSRARRPRGPARVSSRTRCGVRSALHGAVIRAALEPGSSAFVRVLTARVRTCGGVPHTRGLSRANARPPRSSAGFSRLAGERDSAQRTTSTAWRSRSAVRSRHTARRRPRAANRASAARSASCSRARSPAAGSCALAAASSRR